MNLTRQAIIPAAIGGVDGVYTEQAAWAHSFFCISSTGAFRIQVNQNAPVECSANVTFGIPEGANHVVLLNNTAFPVNVTFVLSDAEFISPPSFLGGQVLVPDLQSQAVMAGGDFWTYTGRRSIGLEVRARKYMEVDVQNGNQILLKHGIGTAGTVATLVILACIRDDTVRRFDLSDDLTLHNNTGNNATVCVYEVF